ncbi:MAG: hypothetical protein JWQ01_4929 [Massilia sp.]|nr:hypothetical protein [Massilia sp.]
MTMTNERVIAALQHGCSPALHTIGGGGALAYVSTPWARGRGEKSGRRVGAGTPRINRASNPSGVSFQIFRRNIPGMS